MFVHSNQSMSIFHPNQKYETNEPLLINFLTQYSAAQFLVPTIIGQQALEKASTRNWNPGYLNTRIGTDIGLSDTRAPGYWQCGHSNRNEKQKISDTHKCANIRYLKFRHPNTWIPWFFDIQVPGFCIALLTTRVNRRIFVLPWKHYLGYSTLGRTAKAMQFGELEFNYPGYLQKLELRLKTVYAIPKWHKRWVPGLQTLRLETQSFFLYTVN